MVILIDARRDHHHQLTQSKLECFWRKHRHRHRHREDRGGKKMELLVVLLFLMSFMAVTYSASSPSVIIVGAGISGISSARKLNDAGIYDIVILEATNRTGGRLQKAQFSGYTIELGANWIEGVGAGSNVNPIWEIANKIKLNNHYSDYNNLSSNIYKKEGGLYPEQEASAALDAAERCLNYSSDFSKYLPSKAVNDISVLASQRLFNNIPTNALGMAIDFYYYDYEDSEPPRVTSLKNSVPRITFQDFGEDQYLVTDSRGYESVVDYVAKQFLLSINGTITDNRLKLNKVVRKISYSKHGVKVETEDGSVYQAMYALVSTSIGVLQTNLIEFKPKLPLWKKVAIQGFDMGVFTKIFLKFPYKFWPTGPGTEYFLYADERRGYYPIWQHFEKAYPGSNILMVIVTDEESTRIEQQSDAETEAEVMVVLRKMFGNTVPNSTDILIPRWWSNGFFKGSFSNWPIGFTKLNHDQLRAPVGPVHFTGEHTSMKYYGYVHGGYLAGIDSANTLIKSARKRISRINHQRHV